MSNLTISNQDSYQNLILDSEIEVAPDRSDVSQDAVVQAEAAELKVAYIWLKAGPDDTAFRGKKNDENREITIEALKSHNYQVTVFQNDEFIPHIKSDSTPVDLLIISGHGSSKLLEDLRVQRDTIIQTSYFFFRDFL